MLPSHKDSTLVLEGIQSVMHAGHGKKVQVGCARITPPLSPTLAISLAVSLAISPAPTSTNPD